MFEIDTNELNVILDDFNKWFAHEMATNRIVYEIDAINKLKELAEERSKRHVEKND